jgi:hypothetical protein
MASWPVARVWRIERPGGDAGLGAQSPQQGQHFIPGQGRVMPHGHGFDAPQRWIERRDHEQGASD